MKVARKKARRNGKDICEALVMEQTRIDAKLYMVSEATDLEVKWSNVAEANLKEVNVRGYVEWAKVGGRPRLQS